jgi:hypothetical protein
MEPEAVDEGEGLDSGVPTPLSEHEAKAPERRARLLALRRARATGQVRTDDEEGTSGADGAQGSEEDGGSGAAAAPGAAARAGNRFAQRSMGAGSDDDSGDDDGLLLERRDNADALGLLGTR